MALNPSNISNLEQLVLQGAKFGKFSEDDALRLYYWHGLQHPSSYDPHNPSLKSLASQMAVDSTTLKEFRLHGRYQFLSIGL